MKGSHISEGATDVADAVNAASATGAANAVGARGAEQKPKLATPREPELQSGFGMRGAPHFVYQRIHISGGIPLRLADHLELALRAYSYIYGGEVSAPDEHTVTKQITERLRENRSPAQTSATVMFYLFPDDNGTATLATKYERPLLNAGYALSSLRPRAVSYEYDIPFGGFPTGFQLSARAFFDSLALLHHGATRSVRRRGEVLLSCGDAPLFAIRGKTLSTTPLIDGAMDSIEREAVISAASEAHLVFREQPVRHSEMRTLDELFFADATGITSLSECDGAKFMSLLAARLAAIMRENQ